MKNNEPLNIIDLVEAGILNFKTTKDKFGNIWVYDEDHNSIINVSANAAGDIWYITACDSLYYVGINCSGDDYSITEHKYKILLKKFGLEDLLNSDD